GEREWAEVGDLQRHLPPPAGMDRRRRHVDDQPDPGAGTLAIHEADQARVDLGRPNPLMGLPEEEPTGLDEDPRPFSIDLGIGTGHLLGGDRYGELLREGPILLSPILSSARANLMPRR